MKYKSISIDESIWEILQNDAKPFEDKTPNDVIKKWAHKLGLLPNANLFNPVSSNNYIGKYLKNISFNGKEYWPKDFSDLMIIVCGVLYKLYPDKFHVCLTLKGSRMTYFSKNSFKLVSPKSIPFTKYYVETKLNNKSKIERLYSLMNILGHDVNELVINIY